MKKYKNRRAEIASYIPHFFIPINSIVDMADSLETSVDIKLLF